MSEYDHLTHAIYEKDAKMVKIILEKKEFDLKKTDSFGNTYLHRASYHSNIEIIELLLKFELNPSQKNIKGNTPLHFAAASSNSKNKIRVFLMAGADLFIKNDEGNTFIEDYNGNKDELDLIITEVFGNDIKG